jgi:hypothetical protein
MTRAVVGIIGGSGVYDLPGLANIRRERVTTPWGEPSDELCFGELGATQAVIKPMGATFQAVPGISGSTILGNGRVALILDVHNLVSEAIKDHAPTTNT